MKNFYEISAEQIPDIIKKFGKTHKIIAPQKQNNEVVFKELENAEEIILDYETAYNSFKEFFFPPEEIIFEETDGKIQSPKPSAKPMLIMGLKQEDVEAVTYLDEIMEGDCYYWQKRNNAIFYCVPPILNEKTKENGKNNKLKTLILDSELLADAVTWSRNSEIWDELAKKCLGCGICTYVCPLCYCFSTEDSISLNGKKCWRCRKWDACTLPGFSQISGGHSFRPTIKEKYYNWFYHKFVRAYKEYGKSQCVGCGRCQKYCPAGINIEKVLTQILDDYNNFLNKPNI